jgi:hypothetical protein
MKRRALVLTSESTRHPFRQILPPHVLAPLSKSKARMEDDGDVKLFLLSFVAFFTTFYSFIA